MPSEQDISEINPLYPSIEARAIVLERSRATWAGLVADTAVSGTTLPVQCAALQNMLHKTPSLPAAATVAETTESKRLVVEGQSVWDISASKCEDYRWKKSEVRKVCFAVTHPQMCDTVQTSFSWSGFGGAAAHASAPDHLAVLILGWSYILSARIHELRKIPETDQIRYGDVMAQWKVTHAPDADNEEGNAAAAHMVRLSNIDLAELRWWQAVLSRGVGWTMTFRRLDACFYPSLSLHLKPNSGSNFEIVLDQPPRDKKRPLSAPTSQQALEYLTVFAAAHGIQDQAVAAFAAALTIPAYLRCGAAVLLPRPRHDTISYAAGEHLTSMIPTYDSLAYHIAVACMPNFLLAVISGCFWDPDIECNLVTEWLHPILFEIWPRLLEQQTTITMVRVMAARRPNVGPAVLGAFLTGLLPAMLKLVSQHIPSPMLEAAVWTRSRFSFLDPENHGQCAALQLSTATIRRETEFCLLICPGDDDEDILSAPPACPWSPLGTVQVSSLSLCAKCHGKCGHKLGYVHWCWSNGTHRVPDQGCLSQQITRFVIADRSSQQTIYRYPVKDPQSCHSAVATRSIFTWSLRDGRKPSDNAMWASPWLAGILEAVTAPDDDDMEEIDSNSDDVMNDSSH